MRPANKVRRARQSNGRGVPRLPRTFDEGCREIPHTRRTRRGHARRTDLSPPTPADKRASRARALKRMMYQRRRLVEKDASPFRRQRYSGAPAAILLGIRPGTSLPGRGAAHRPAAAAPARRDGRRTVAARERERRRVAGDAGPPAWPWRRRPAPALLGVGAGPPRLSDRRVDRSRAFEPVEPENACSLGIHHSDQTTAPTSILTIFGSMPYSPHLRLTFA